MGIKILSVFFIFTTLICIYSGLPSKTYKIKDLQKLSLINVEKDTIVNIQLLGSPTEGYSWFLEENLIQQNKLKLRNLNKNHKIGEFSSIKSDLNLGIYNFKFFANKEGKQSLNFILKCPWEKSYKTLKRVVVNVLPKAKISTNLKSDDDYFSKLRRKAEKMFRNNTDIELSASTHEFKVENGIKYLIRFLLDKKLSLKPNPLAEGKSGDDYFDPFANPSPKLLVDEDFSPFHKLMFAKYCISEFHFLIVTKNSTSQFTQLFPEDFGAAAKVMKLINGFSFFNGGLAAGASQPHKHLQAIRYEFDADYGLFLISRQNENLEYIDDIQEEKLYRIKPFEFNHFLVKFSKETTEKIKSVTENNYLTLGKQLYNIWVEGMIAIQIFNDPVEIKTQYTMIFTSEFLFVVPRSKYILEKEYGRLDLNSVVFTMLFLAKTQEIKQQFLKMDLRELLNEISFE